MPVYFQLCTSEQKKAVAIGTPSLQLLLEHIHEISPHHFFQIDQLALQVWTPSVPPETMLKFSTLQPTDHATLANHWYGPVAS
jgi:hypothetical protein